MSARHFKYYDDWKSETLTCPKCGWTGAFEEGAVEYYDQLNDCSCPVCDPAPMLAIVEYPTMEESKANWGKVSEAEKARLDFRSSFLAEWEASLLKSEDQLPDLDWAFLIILAWDLEGWEKHTPMCTVIRHGKREVWRELACFEGADGFAELVAILKKKYGSRLIDVVPTRRSGIYLYGDHLDSFDVVREARKSLGGGLPQLSTPAPAGGRQSKRHMSAPNNSRRPSPTRQPSTTASRERKPRPRFPVWATCSPSRASL